MQRRLSEFLAAAKILERRGAAPDGTLLDPVIAGLAYDSRRVGPGFLFFALPGLHADGHRFVPAAIDAGAVAVVHRDPLPEYRSGVVYLRVADPRFSMSPLAAAFYGWPSSDLAVVGVTGTEGKSTTVYLCYQLLDLAGEKAGFVSTVQYRTGEEERWNPEHQTTPEATQVQASLAAMRDSGKDYAVLEASSHGLSPRTNRLGDVDFDVAVMTNVTHEHLEFHGTWEQYRQDKANLFRSLDRIHSLDRRSGGPAISVAGDAGSPGPEGHVAAGRTAPRFGVANADDPSFGYFASATAAPVRSFSAAGKPLADGTPADLAARDIVARPDGNDWTLFEKATGRAYAVADRLPGAFNVGNIMAALLVVAGLLERPVEDLIPLVPRLRPVRGRMTAVLAGQPFEVIVDYAHTPSSFETLFPPIRSRAEGRIFALFGSGGERDTAKRPRQGRIAADWCDVLVLADEDPRGEDPMALLEEIAAGCPEKRRDEDLFLIPDRATAIRKAFALAGPGDIVLLLGKGHENSIIYADKTIPYDEIAEAERALGELGYQAAPREKFNG